MNPPSCSDQLLDKQRTSESSGLLAYLPQSRWERLRECASGIGRIDIDRCTTANKSSGQPRPTPNAYLAVYEKRG